MSYISSVDDHDWKYPAIQPNKEGWLEVSARPLHQIYWAEYGTPEGEPVLFLHGGPGGGTSPVMARFFNPERYRIILFDQRGCGKSRPNAADNSPADALADNTTPHLISDILSLRQELGIQGKAHVFGGSWGSTLALAYAIAHPDTVQTLVLRGIFLCRRKDLDYFYQGNAAYYATLPYDTSLPGAYICYPEAWKSYVEVIPPSERNDMVKAYARRFATYPETAKAQQHLTDIATAWSLWEGMTSYLAPEPDAYGRFAEPDFARAFARIENHYFMNGAFLGGEGEANRDQDYLLSHVHRLKDIPIHIVHGRYDQVCPLFQAEELVSALKAAGAAAIDYRITAAAHSMMERENCMTLTDIMDQLPPLT